MLRATSTLLFSLLVPALLFAQTSLLQSGPMNGYSEMREVLVWLQTTEPANVQLAYWPEKQNDKRMESELLKTVQQDANVAKFIISNLDPGITYHYEVLINGRKETIDRTLQFETQPLWQYRTDPPRFRVALGSCTYINETAYDRPGEPYGGEYGIFDEIVKTDPDMMLWLGDNIYLREADWWTRSGMLHRYTHTRSTPEMQALLSACHHYAIWDDHDFGPNDADGSWVHKDRSLEAFKLFWGNNGYGISGLEGTTSMFRFRDVDFFLLDNRTNRTPRYDNAAKREILGTEQIDWLIDALKSSQASFKLVCVGGQFLNTSAVYENHANFPVEREKLIARLAQENIPGVIFLTGDRHHTELSKMKIGNHMVYDLTVSPLTSGSHVSNETNGLQVEGTLVQQRNFATLDVSGKYGQRLLAITVYDNTGKVLWQEEIKQQD